MIRWIKFTKLLAIIALLSIGACGSIENTKRGVKIDDIFATNNKIPNFINATNNSNSNFIRTQNNELHNRFPLLPNPTINLFVYPHLDRDNNPVPGYTTKFNLYLQNEYALPREVY